MSNQALFTPELTVPGPGAWVADKSHSRVGFIARHLVVSKTRGTFQEYDVRATIGGSVETSSVEVDIQAASIETGDAKRDEHLRSADFLDADVFPTLTFRSTKVRQVGPASLEVDGDLTIKDVTKSVILKAEYDGLVTDPWGKEHAAFTAVTSFDREDFGLTWNVALEAGGVLVGKKIQIEIEIEIVPAG